MLSHVNWNEIKNLLDKVSIHVNSDESIFLICGVCNRIMIEPHQIICGCRACIQCIKDYLRNDGKGCPVGNFDECKHINLSNDLDCVFVEKESAIKILNLICHCPVLGCDFEGTLADMVAHVSTCKALKLGGNSSDIIKKMRNKAVRTLKRKADLLDNSTMNKIQNLGETMNKLAQRMESLERKLDENNSRIDLLATKVSDITEKINEERNDEFIWKVDNYSVKKAKGSSINSIEFYTKKNGYKLKLVLDPRGDKKGSGYLSLYFYIVEGDYDDILPWPFEYHVTLSVVDQDSLSRDHNYTIKYPPSEEYLGCYQKPISVNSGFGSPKFLAISTLESTPYLLRDDTLYIRCSVSKERSIQIPG